MPHSNPLGFLPQVPGAASLGLQQQPLISLGQETAPETLGEPETPSKFRDFSLRLGARQGSLLFALSSLFGLGTEEIAARKRRDLETKLFEQEAQARLTATPQRKILEDVAGRKRFLDTGKAVFEDVQSPVKPLTNIQEVAPGKFAGLNAAGQLEEIKTGFDFETAKQLDFKDKRAKLKFEQTSKLIDTAKKDPRVSDFLATSVIFDRVQVASDSAAGDISLIFAFMKMLDSKSTVREGEFATAQNSGSVSENIWSAYNQALTGERLVPARRDDFKQQAQAIFDRSRQTADKALKPIEARATKRELDAQTIREQIFGVTPPAVPPALASRPGVEGEIATNNETGQKFVSKDGQWQPL